MGEPWPWERLPGGRWLGRLLLAGILVAWLWVLATWPVTWAAALLVAAVVGVGILIQPILGLVLVAFAVPFGSLRSLSIGGAAIGAQDVLLAATAGAWLARQLARRRLGLKWPALGGAGLVLLGVMLASFLPATALGPAVKELAKWIELLLALFLVVNLADRAGVTLLALALLTAGTAEGLLGLYQFVARVGPPGFLLMGRFMRAAGTFAQPNPYGGYLGMILPLALALVLTVWPGRAWRTERRLAALWAVGAAAGVLMLGGLGASWSRGAWIGAAAALAAVVLARGGAWLRGALAGVLLAATLCVLLLGRIPVPGFLQTRFADLAGDLVALDVRNVEVTDANYAVVERAAHWYAAWGMLSEHPWTGVGLGNYATAYERYALPRWPDPLGHAHNYYLNIAAEAGLPGLAAYLLWMAAGLWVIARAVRGSQGLEQGLALGALGLWVHLAVHSMFDNLYVHGMAIHVGLLLGMAAWVALENRRREA
ncbi:MAG: O-antigen ligase family protein [Anaerolineae bacterium]|nr:O-antigen ligase family protein [Anaerolineae bacterium]